MAGEWREWLLAHVMEVLSLGVSAGALIFAVLAYVQTAATRRDSKRSEAERAIEGLERAFGEVERAGHDLRVRCDLSDRTWNAHLDQTIPPLGHFEATKRSPELRRVREVRQSARRIQEQADQVRSVGVARDDGKLSGEIGALRAIVSKLEALELDLPPEPKAPERRL